jgi:hypothetical protein
MGYQKGTEEATWIHIRPQVLMPRKVIDVILPVLFGCETWSLKLREERRLTAFENRALRRIIGPKRDAVTR